MSKRINSCKTFLSAYCTAIDEFREQILVSSDSNTLAFRIADSLIVRPTSQKLCPVIVPWASILLKNSSPTATVPFPLPIEASRYENCLIREVKILKRLSAARHRRASQRGCNTQASAKNGDAHT